MFWIQMNMMEIHFELTRKKVKYMMMIVQHSHERINLLAATDTYHQILCATGDSHITSDNFFQAIEIPIEKKRIEKL